MGNARETNRASAAVATKVQYVNEEWRDRDEIPMIGSKESRHANTRYHDIVVHDARNRDDLDLDVNGFVLLRHQTPLSQYRAEDAIAQRYYPEVCALVCAQTGADRAVSIGHQYRHEAAGFNDAYARFAHCDHNPGRVRELSEQYLTTLDIEPQPHWQYAWYNTWQPVDHVVEQNPLALIDATSLGPNDVIGYYYGTEDRNNLVAAPVYNPNHRWHYFNRMQLDELLMFKQLDSRPGQSTQVAPHSSFHDQSVSTDVLPRRSVETRIIAIWESAG